MTQTKKSCTCPTLSFSFLREPSSLCPKVWTPLMQFHALQVQVMQVVLVSFPDLKAALSGWTWDEQFPSEAKCSQELHALWMMSSQEQNLCADTADVQMSRCEKALSYPFIISFHPFSKGLDMFGDSDLQSDHFVLETRLLFICWKLVYHRACQVRASFAGQIFEALFPYRTAGSHLTVSTS